MLLTLTVRCYLHFQRQWKEPKKKPVIYFDDLKADWETMVTDLTDFIPECLRVAVVAHFASQYEEVKSLFFTRIYDSHWENRELRDHKHSESIQSNNFYSLLDVRVAKHPPANVSFFFFNFIICFYFFCLEFRSTSQYKIVTKD